MVTELNRLKPIANRSPGTLVIHEIYRSIQGESRYAGLPCVFVRTTGCDLRCHWCDTPHAFTEGSEMSVDDVCRRVLKEPGTLVEITGGEPLLQHEVHTLISLLLDAGKTVLLETSGAADIAAVDQRAHIIMDLKCPGSGECEKNRYENLEHLKDGDEIKFVVADRTDFEWVAAQLRERDLGKFSPLVSPVHGRLNLRTLAEWILESGLPLRLQPQLHKFVWEPDARGV